MNDKTTRAVLVLIMGLAASLGLQGMHFGVPSKQTALLLFSSPQEQAALVPQMAARREVLYQKYSEKSDLPLLQGTVKQQCQDPSPPIKWENKTFPAQRLDSMRSHLLQPIFPDDPTMMKILAQINWRKGDFNPRSYAYGGIYFYSCGASMLAGSLLGAVRLTSDITHYLSRPEHAARLDFIPKIMAVLIFVLSIPLLFLVTRENYDHDTALLAAALYAFCPIILIYSHFLKPYVFLLPIAIACFGCSMRILTRPEPRWRRWAGIFAGITGACFPYAIAILACPVAAYALKNLSGPQKGAREIKSLIGDWLKLGAFTALGFVFANPYWVLDFGSVYRELSSFKTLTIPGSYSWSTIRDYCFFTIPSGIGWGTGFLFWGGLVLAAAKRKPADFVLGALVVPYILYGIAAPAWWWHEDLHTSMVIVPALVILAARLLAEILRNSRPLGLILAGAVILGSFTNTLFYASLFSTGDTRLRAGDFINKNIPPGSSIGSLHPMTTLYPPFRQLDYDLRMPDCAKSAPDFYIDLNYPQNNITAFGKNYELYQAFVREPNFLDKIYVNRLAHVTERPLSIYKNVH